MQFCLAWLAGQLLQHSPASLESDGAGAGTIYIHQILISRHRTQDSVSITHLSAGSCVQLVVAPVRCPGPVPVQTMGLRYVDFILQSIPSGGVPCRAAVHASHLSAETGAKEPVRKPSYCRGILCEDLLAGPVGGH